MPRNTLAPNTVYLGDGVYAALEHGRVKLFTHDGVQTTNTIYLEPEVITALRHFLEPPKP